MASDLGTVTETDEGIELRFERHVGREPDEVWRALTDEEELAAWAGDAELDLRPGGHIRIDGVDGERIKGEIVEVEPLKRLSFTWDSDRRGSAGRVTFELSPGDPDGTLLVLTHVMPDDVFRASRPRIVAGWLCRLYRLGTAPELEEATEERRPVAGRYAGVAVYA